MPREISTFGFSAAIRQKLLRNGYTDSSCFKDVTPLKLARGDTETLNVETLEAQ